MLILYVAMNLVSAVLKWVSLALVYNIDKKTLEVMQSELSEKR